MWEICQCLSWERVWFSLTNERPESRSRDHSQPIRGPRLSTWVQLTFTLDRIRRCPLPPSTMMSIYDTGSKHAGHSCGFFNSWNGLRLYVTNVIFKCSAIFYSLLNISFHQLSSLLISQSVRSILCNHDASSVTNGFLNAMFNLGIRVHPRE